MAKGNLRNHRRTLSVLMALLLVGSAVTFQIGMKIMKDEQKIDAATRAHDKALLNKSFNAATSFKTMYEMFAEWYVADYRYDNPGTGKTDNDIMTGYTWSNPDEVNLYLNRSVFYGNQGNTPISAVDTENTLDAFVKTDAKSTWSTYNTYNLEVKGIKESTLKDDFLAIYDIAKVNYETLKINCLYNWDSEAPAIDVAKACLIDNMPEAAWNDNGVVESSIKVLQQEIWYDDALDRVFFNIEMAKALHRLETGTTLRLTEFARWFRNGVATQLTNPANHREYMIISSSDFKTNAKYQEFVTKGDIHFMRRA